MEDWSSELLYQVIDYLNVYDSNKLAQQSRRLYYHVYQYRNVLCGPQLVASCSYEVEGSSTTSWQQQQQKTCDEVCKDIINKSQNVPNFVLSFGTNISQLYKKLPSYVPNNTILLGATAGTVQANLPSTNTKKNNSTTTTTTNLNYQSHSGLMAISGMNNIEIRPFHLNCEQNIREQDITNLINSFEQDKSWKMFIVYACGRGHAIAEQYVSQLQNKFPNSTIVGGICVNAYVSKPINSSTYTRNHLARIPSIDLIDMIQSLGAPAPSQGITKTDLVNIVLQLIQTKQYIIEHINTTNGGGICGIGLCGTNVPIRTIVSRGFQSLTELRINNDGTPKSKTNFYIHNAELITSNNPNYLFNRRQSIGIDNSPSYYIIRQIRDATTGRIYTPHDLYHIYGEPEFIGLRHVQDINGFTVKMPHPISFNMNAFIIGCDDDNNNNNSNEQQQQQQNNNNDNNENQCTIIGYNFDMYDLNGKECMKDMDICIQRLYEQTINEEILGCMMFSCSGRGPTAGLLISEDMSDARKFANKFPTTPCLGFYAGGEIGPMVRVAAHENIFQHGHACLQCFTAVFALFIVPKPTDDITKRAAAAAAQLNTMMNDPNHIKEFIRNKLLF